MFKSLLPKGTGANSIEVLFLSAILIISVNNLEAFPVPFSKLVMELRCRRSFITDTSTAAPSPTNWSLFKGARVYFLSISLSVCKAAGLFFPIFILTAASVG